MAQEPVKVVVTIEGGMVMDVSCCGIPIQVAIIDYDCDGCDDDDKEAIPQGDGTFQNAITSFWEDSAFSPHGIAQATQTFEIARIASIETDEERQARITDSFHVRER